jgi:DNA-binding transcriptional ArsR family regulator
MDVFTALADPVRRSLLRSIRAGTVRVVDLAADHPISRPAISRHLRLLTEAGLVVATERGRERHYELTPGALAPVAELVEELSEDVAGWPLGQALDALDTEVRRVSRERRVTGRPSGTRPNRHEEIA